MLFDIKVGFLNADVMTELSAYETNSWVKSPKKQNSDVLYTSSFEVFIDMFNVGVPKKHYPQLSAKKGDITTQ